MMQGELRSLTYTSRAADGLDEDAIFRIYKAALELNAIDGITGLLVYDGQSFMQIIEGGQEALDALVVRLRQDPRHCDFNILDERTIAVRSFAGWSMRMVKVDRAHLRAVEDLDVELGARVQPDVRAMLLANAAVMTQAA